MAYKKYAYYNKGNKIAIIQEGDAISNGKLAVAHCTISGYSTKDTCEAAGGQWIPGSSSGIDTIGEYKSPSEDVANGLEIEYTYAPVYNAGDSVVPTTEKSPMNGWYVDEDGYVNLLRTNFDWDAGGVSSVGYVADAWIHIEGSGTWQGIHKIKSVGTEAYHGNVQLYTKWKDNYGMYQPAANFNFDTDETIAYTDAEDFAGIQITKRDKGEFFDYLSVPVTREGYTQRDLDHAEADMDIKLAIDYLMYTGFDLSSLIDSKAKTQTAKSLKERISRNEDRVKSTRRSTRRSKNVDLDNLDLSI